MSTLTCCRGAFLGLLLASFVYSLPLYGQTVTFDTPGEHTYTIPQDGEVTITARGADGGNTTAYPNQASGGAGATVAATFSVQAGDELTVFVGEAGNEGGGGGGGSAVVLKQCGSLAVVLVAGAGGGAGDGGSLYSPGWGGTSSNGIPWGGRSIGGGEGGGGGGFLDDGDDNYTYGDGGGGGGATVALMPDGDVMLRAGDGGGSGNHGGGGGGGYGGGNGGEDLGSGGDGGSSFMASTGTSVVRTDGGDGGGSGRHGEVTIGGSALPVELTAFTATGRGEGVLLEWSTASETGNAGFEVQRRAEGRAWETIAFVEGNGTRSEAQRYQYEDAALPFEAKRVRYRLRQVDHDGASTFGPETELVRGAPARSALHAPFPNPFDAQTTLRYELAAPSHVRIVVYDAAGREVAHLVDGQREAGRHAATLTARSLPAGVYVARIEAGTFTATQQLVLVK